MTTDLHLSTGAMALDCLPPQEASEFTDHLADCSTCSSELIGFRETAALLGSAVAERPPASLRVSVMAAIRVTPQLPPLTGPARDVLLGRHRESEPGPQSEPVETVTPEKSGTVTPLRWYRRPQAFLAAAVAALVIAGGATTLIVANNDSPTPPAAACATTAVDQQTKVPQVGSGGNVVYSASCRQAIVNMPALAPLADGKVYQLWVIKGSTPRSAGVVALGAGGAVAPVEASLEVGDTDIGVSIEPGPGPSALPTTTPIWVVHL